jgi:replication factor C small subunit
MERFTETCRFIMIANYSGKIIEPLQSRCAPFRFSYMSQQDQNRYLRNIIEKVNIKILDEGYDAIFEVSQGDLRRATNTIQAAASMGKEIDAETVYSVIGHANPEDVDTMLKTAMKGDFLAARKLLREMILKYGVAGSDIIKQIHSAIFRSQLPDSWKVTLSEAVGEADFRMVQGADVEVQLSALLARMTEAGQELRRGC